MSDDFEKSFNFFMPLDIEKAHKDAHKDHGKRIIEGIASVEIPDLQDEIVCIKGMDTSYFEKHGFINDDHKSGPGALVGQPISLAHTTVNGYPALFLKAFLFKEKKAADDWWELIHSLKKSGASRKVGFSIQGKTLLRKGKYIVKSWIYAISITANPINVMSFCDVAKSFSGLQLLPESANKGCMGGIFSATIYDRDAAGVDIPEHILNRDMNPEQLMRFVQQTTGLDLAKSKTLALLIEADVKRGRKR